MSPVDNTSRPPGRDSRSTSVASSSPSAVEAFLRSKNNTLTKQLAELRAELGAKHQELELKNFELETTVQEQQQQIEHLESIIATLPDPPALISSSSTKEQELEAKIGDLEAQVADLTSGNEDLAASYEEADRAAYLYDAIIFYLTSQQAKDIQRDEEHVQRAKQEAQRAEEPLAARKAQWPSSTSVVTDWVDKQHLGDDDSEVIAKLQQGIDPNSSTRPRAQAAPLQTRSKISPHEDREVEATPESISDDVDDQKPGGESDEIWHTNRILAERNAVLEKQNVTLVEKNEILSKKIDRTLDAFIPKAATMRHQSKINKKTQDVLLALEKIVREGLREN